jgi:uncharacterized protein
MLDENDTWGEIPLYEAVIKRLLQLEISGATVFRGVMGFGKTHEVHHKHLFGISDDRPITLLVAEEERLLRQAIPEIRGMTKESPLLMLDAEWIG